MQTLVSHECVSPRAKSKIVGNEPCGFGGQVPKFTAGKPFLEEKYDAFKFSTPVLELKEQLCDDGMSTAAPSPAMTDLSSTWTTPTLGCSTSSSSDMTNAPWGINCAQIEAHLKHDGPGTRSVLALLPFWAPPFGDSGMISLDEISWLYNPGNLSLPLPAASSPSGTPWKSAETIIPATPQIQHYSRMTPPPAPKAATMPPLLRALCEDSTESVQRTLEQDAYAATDLFWEHDVEPPLCTAVRLGCCPEVVGLLLEHQADVNSIDSRGRTPLAILAWRSAQSRMQEPRFCDSRTASSQADATEARQIAIEKLLIQAGADQNHSSIAAARRPQEAIGPFIGATHTSSLLPWDMDTDLAALIREHPPPL